MHDTKFSQQQSLNTTPAGARVLRLLWAQDVVVLSGYAAAAIMVETNNKKTSFSCWRLSGLIAGQSGCAACAHLAGDDLFHHLLPLPNRHCLAWMNQSQKALPLLLQSMGQRHLKSRVLQQDSLTESDTMQSHALAYVLRYYLKQA